MNEWQQKEWIKCALSPHYFIHTYCNIYDPNPKIRKWLPFHLWRGQNKALQIILGSRQIIMLKARQLGLTWLVIGYALWMMLFLPGSIILMFSLREDEAVDLLSRIHGPSEDRIGGMYDQLPGWMKEQVAVAKGIQLKLLFFSNGSTARAFPATKRAGRSFTASLVIVDEADFLPYFKQLMTAVRPTIDAEGKIIVLSTSDKDRPGSEFKRLYKKSAAKLSDWASIFLSWSERPDRSPAWYQDKTRSYTQDDLWQEYPATAVQALAGRSEGRRFQAIWLDNAFQEKKPIQAGPALPGLTVYQEPQDGRSYVIATDTSEGDVTSDPSPSTIFDKETWQEAGHMHGIYEPKILAGYLGQLSDYYNTAVLCVERNNHGHAVHVALEALGYVDRIYINPFDKKQGWLSNLKYKTLAMDNAADILREGSTIIRTEATQLELGSIEAATLKAPKGEFDDRALAYIIGLAALRWPTAVIPSFFGQGAVKGWQP